MPRSASDNTGMKAFVSAYTSVDEPRIRFEWNGKHSDEFEDANMAFRQGVMEIVLSDIDAAPIELVRALFKAETECSREAWGIEEGVGELAERLLRADPERFVEDYLTGKFQSFDTECGTSFPTDQELAVRLLRIVRSRLAGPLSDERRCLLQQGDALFQSWQGPA